ncbi:MarR family winged helix-turn-helix transcriptional regulator [Deinococcus sp. Leaf326]|jgi:DNA-binding MarR family transcriptional regulator|uniref:MarR family winged helix-turn-helix transcriptional regulator n=1 Tax=Deinococcus sp. Leaf326 TaxID=1736338 RepID=UPI000701624D|nr:MarR family winged helix-turn-helix transcriptional regulator [Deinococcus sp. Leaf326]KQR04488.1 MarR family transcriptional regulator [Deinococcus sp. Leaf326]
MKDSPLPQDELYGLVRLTLRLARHFRQRLDEPLEQAVGLNTGEVLVLSAIMDGCDTPSAVARRQSLPAPTVTRMVTKLADAGLVQRVTDPSDLRRQRLQLTAQGEATRLKTRESAQGIVQDNFGTLDPAQVSAALAALDTLSASLDLCSAPPVAPAPRVSLSSPPEAQP